MKAVVFRDIGDIRLEDVPEPRIQKSTDAIVGLTTSTICGTDLHMVRGTMPGMEPGTILGHEGVGIVEEIGSEIRNLSPGDRVVIPSTIACGYCVYCRAGYFAKCDNANPNGKRAGTAFFGGPKSSGPFHGLQAEKARIPFANIGAVKLPVIITDAQAILLSDVFPTGYFGAELAEIHKGDTIAVFGCGPVGLFTILSAQLMGAGRVFAVDQIPSRLNMARSMGAEVINFNEDDPVEVILTLTGGIGVDRAIDAVGVDAQRPNRGPAAISATEAAEQFQNEVRQAAPRTNIQGENWKPGKAPSQALCWAVESLAKAGTLSIIGVYPSQFGSFPIGRATDKNLTVNMGACHHRKYFPLLIELIESGAIDLPPIITQIKPLSSAIEAYKAFDLRKPEWTKVQLVLTSSTEVH
jgi:threonine dehydrogenase-like Zn-dependent dehydrogenase